MKTFFFFFGEHLRFVSLVLGLGLEHSCPWPRECLSSERLSLALALASDFFCVLGLGLEPCVLDSTSVQYCISSWGTASKSTLAPLFILQKRSIRLLTGSGYREHTNPLFYRAKCLKLKDIYSLETAKLMYKIHNNVLSFANSDKFNLIKNCYTHKTRLSHKNNFFLPRTRTRLGQKSLSFAGIKVWNEIPSSMKEVSFYRFKKAVKAHFYQTMKPIQARITAFYQQCSSNYRNKSCIFMLEFNNNLFYCLNSMSLVHSSITLLLQYVISHFDVPLNY